MRTIFVILVLSLFGSFQSFASPDCLDKNGNPLPIDNQRVITMESTTPNQYLVRAHVKGVIGKIYPDRNGHNHFEAILGSNLGDKVEIVYSQDFGALPDLSSGMTIEACGDYITSTVATSEYPASPDRAIIHWVHRSDSDHHQSGYVMIDGTLYGQDKSKGLQSISLLNAKPSFKRMITVVLENTNYDEALEQPFLAELVKKGALFTHFLAETHPSQPNYIAMIAGDTLGVRTDSNANLDGRHIGDLLKEKGLSWKAYAEDYPGNCFLGKTSGRYARKHVPFLSFKSVQEDPAECAKVVNASEMEQDYKNQSMPTYSFYVPDLDHDGHDTGAEAADQWLAGAFGPMIADAAFMKDTLLVVTFDESENLLGKNQIYTVLVGANVTPGSTVSTSTNHYSLLKLLEETFGLGSLGNHDVAAQGITGIWF